MLYLLLHVSPCHPAFLFLSIAVNRDFSVMLSIWEFWYIRQLHEAQRCREAWEAGVSGERSESLPNGVQTLHGHLVPQLHLLPLELSVCAQNSQGFLRPLPFCFFFACFSPPRILLL